MTLQALHSPRFAKVIRSVVAVVVFAATLLSMISTFTLEAAATYETKYGIVNTIDDPLTVRSGPGKGNSSLGTVAIGAQVTIVGEDKDSAGTVWYKIEYNGGYGYVSSQFIKITSTEGDAGSGTEGETGGETDTPVDMTDFEAWLDSQGFPESYKASLRALHEKYPNWVFKAMHVEYEWDYAVSQEYILGKSLVENSFPSSWKSTQEGAYNWETSTWKGLDGARWVAASWEIIEYYMDARNFLDSETVFQFLDQTFNEELHTVEGVQALLDGTFMEGELPDAPGITYANCIYEASKQNDANPYVIASMILTEQSPTGSALCSGTYPGYEGYYNFFNIGAAAGNGNSAVVNGLLTAQENKWNTRQKSINDGVELYANQYIKAGQINLYLKRFNVQGTSAFYHQYMTSVYGAKVEGELTAQGYTDEDRAQPLLFIIPVYKNMPANPCVKPTGDGSPNIKLSSLEVEGYNLTPDFQPDILEYTLVVPANTNSVNIKAVTMDAAAKVAGAGAVNLTNTENTVKITVTAGNGSTRTYTLTIAKEAPGIEGIEFSGAFTMSGTYVVASPGTTAETMASTLLSTGSAIITLSDGSSKDRTAVLKTGDKILIYDTDGNSKGVYVVCVKGDINGDGIVGHNDFTMLRNRLIRVQTLEGISGAAADINLDGTISNNDFTLMRNHIINVVPIS